MTTPVFSIVARDGNARAGMLTTPHGRIETPVFMPVGTQATVKAVSPDLLRRVGATVILGNTYHLYLRPGDELIRDLGGLHRFMAWDRPILTDSGGYQVFSLQSIRTLTEEGVWFRSHLDGSKHLFSPEKVVDIQKNLGSDIMMVLDECVGYGQPRAYVENSLELTARWAERARLAYPQGLGQQLLFGIIQGGFHLDLRLRSLQQITSIPFDGFALGGLSVGEPIPEMYELIAGLAPRMPAHSPRYLMGVGTPMDILTGIEHGLDMFDCVLPTRNARNGTLFTSLGRLNIKKSHFRRDDSPLDPNCTCPTCAVYSRAYLCHLYHARELLAYTLNTVHNLAFFTGLARRAREAVLAGSFAGFKADIARAYE